jgi:hypothetical protein
MYHKECPRKSGVTGMKGTHQLLAYADEVNILGENMNAIRKTALLGANNEVDLEVNAGVIKYNFVSPPECGIK